MKRKSAALSLNGRKAPGGFVRRIGKDLRKNCLLYLLVLPGLLYYIIFKYVPMYGVLLAFKDYKVKKGITGSPWVGLDHFIRFFNSYNCGLLIRNTIGISVYTLLVGFPLAIVFAVLLNYVKGKYLKKSVQMVSYAPHFISTVVICGMLSIFMNLDNGIFNHFLMNLGFDPIDFLAKPKMFKSIYVWSGVWQGMGWSAIIYISALSGVDYEMHEAAIVDGATKMQRILHVDLPSIKPTIIMNLILQLGSLMSVGFEKVYLLKNTLNEPAAEVISTYVYQMGLINRDFGFSTAVGLFNSLINMALLLTANRICRKVADESLF